MRVAYGFCRGLKRNSAVQQKHKNGDKQTYGDPNNHTASISEAQSVRWKHVNLIQ